MEFHTFYLKCLAQASYLIGDGGTCAIVDPRRDVDLYIKEAASRGLTIGHVIETHLHADFVSGHVELANRTGAVIHISHRASAAFEHQPVQDGDELVMGDTVLRFLETPGHTPESVCVLVLDRAHGDRPLKVLTGDTLFIGDVGRPDLVAAKGLTAEQMASMLYDSLHSKLLTLPDDVEVHPAHGAGSACGKNIGSELSSTIGAQKELNHALQPMSKEQFVSVVTTGLPPPPAYFGHDAEMNRQGAVPLADLPALPALSPQDVESAVSGGAMVLDVRDKALFGAGHLPGAVNIGLAGSFAPWAGSLLPHDVPLVIVAEGDVGADEARVRLARVGLHAVAGWLAGGVSGWRDAGLELAGLAHVSVDDLARRLAGAADAPLVLDVRAPGEHASRHVPGAVNLPLPELLSRVDELDPTRPTAVICASGYRSSAAASLLQRAGFERLWNVAGGTNAWVAAELETESEELARS
ncbi:MAG: MBL fold metallo-hydrolase [Planctomycetota bacterium]|jgi:glyoxylase-like metal-dependent hydrolase (beta-lactamase superfamily II)/rhodanese-related sulfurtransferase